MCGLFVSVHAANLVSHVMLHMLAALSRPASQVAAGS
jgi:hypothetical protein